MTPVPIDSTDARERREADEEREQLEALPHDERCSLGWLGEDEFGRPIPCPLCRPHVARSRRLLQTQLTGPTWAHR